MGFTKSILLAGALALATFAAPIPDCPDEVEGADAVGALTAENLIAMAAATASCAGAPYPDECADASQAATAINKSFETYNITEVGEQAALVAYMLFESGNFKYKNSHFPVPGTPGKGTRMMASPSYVKSYATSVAGGQAVAQAEEAGGDAGLNAILALVNSDDEKSFGSAAWFLTSQCTADVRAGLVAETTEGWHNFLTVCVQTPLDLTRDTPWVAAKQVMLGATS